MPSRSPERGPNRFWELAAGLGLLGCGLGPAPAWGQSAADMINTKHNLSVSGAGSVRALTETRVCVFCHTPHNATPASPLWNKDLEPQVYTPYSSPTLKAGPLPQPSGPTKLCLSCHDGTIAMGAVVNPAGGIGMAGTGQLPTGSLSDFGLDLSGHHPVSFPYSSALPNTELASSPPADLDFGSTDEVHCMTCHDPHNDQYGRFLAKDNRYSALCTTCHQMNGWAGSEHATSDESVVGVLPRPPKTWPAYTELREWGCEACHTPHFAPTAPQLLNFTAGPPPFSCTECHGAEPPIHVLLPGTPAPARRGAAQRVDIAGQIRKVSAHHESAAEIRAAPGVGAARSGIPSVSCSDCHNPHQVNSRKSEAPFASGMLEGVSGIDRNGAPVAAARYEYEVCLKCHGDNARDLEYVPRVVGGTNMRLAFDTANPSYHPVVGISRALNSPSLPSSLEPRMRSTETLYCTSCHADDAGGSRGPHGSDFTPILKERYETADLTAESYDNYVLCYRCHERSSILRDDSFRKKTTHAAGSGGGHSGHLAAGASCAACHDPHGVSQAGASETGSHAHLIDFDTRIVLPLAGNRAPVYNVTGTFSGSCALVCHGVVHDNTAYP